MKIVVTGLNGTLAPHFARSAALDGIEVIGWDRSRIDPGDCAAGQQWLDTVHPDAIVHMAMGAAGWAGQLAQHCAQRAMPFLFTSTAMVFHHEPDGPHHPDSPRNAQDDYGRYKIECEDAVLGNHPGATVARIGWQIDPQQAGNNMLMALDQWQARDGHVAASTAWRPACSFMADTSQALLALLRNPVAGVVHLDSNADEGHSFDRIVQALRTRFQRDGWVVRAHADYRHDQRLAGPSRLMPPLSARLPLAESAQ